MAATDFIVAIELGSSKITGIAGKKHADGSIQVLALASENSSDFIRKGVIYNLDKTAQSLTSIIKKLESTLKASIGKVYVGIGGQSLRTIRNTEVRHLEEETKISQELIDSIMDSNREVPIIDQEILEVAPQEYKVGINLLADPVGVPSDHIEGRFLNIIARSSVKFSSINASTLKGLFGRLLPDIASVLFADYPKEEQLRLIDRCCQEEHKALLAQCAPLYPDLEKTLQQLKEIIDCSLSATARLVISKSFWKPVVLVLTLKVIFVLETPETPKPIISARSFRSIILKPLYMWGIH